MESLPSELLQDLAKYLPPEAIDPVTSTSKHIRRVLQPLILCHQGLKREFGYAVCGKARYNGSIARLLINVLVKPELRFYVRGLTVEGWYNELYDGNPLSHPEVYQDVYESREDAAAIEPKVATIDTVRGVFRILLWSLKELRILRLVAAPGDESGVFRVIFDVRNRPSHTSQHPSPPSLQNLRAVQLDSGAEGSTWAIATAQVFSYLSSLRSLSLVGIHDNQRNRWMVKSSAKPSNVEHLSLQSCLIEDKIMCSFVRDFPRLKSLELELEAEALPPPTGLTSSSPARGLTDCSWLGIALQAFHKDTLETLRLRSTPPFAQTNFIGDISGLSRLRYLDISAGGLLNWDEGDALLPESLVELCVDFGDASEGFRIVGVYCEGLVKAKSRDHPSLRRIVLKYDHESSELKNLIHVMEVINYTDLEQD